MQADFTPADAKAGACAYVLHCLLQRLEVQTPGLVLDLLNGVRADHLAVEKQLSLSEPVRQVFQEAIHLLERCHAQNLASTQNP